MALKVAQKLTEKRKSHTVRLSRFESALCKPRDEKPSRPAGRQILGAKRQPTLANRAREKEASLGLMFEINYRRKYLYRKNLSIFDHPVYVSWFNSYRN